MGTHITIFEFISISATFILGWVFGKTCYEIISESLKRK